MTQFFDLGLIGYPGYKMDKDGGVYSTKTTATPKKMFGSGVQGNKYYTLSIGHRPATVSGKVLKMRAEAHAGWKASFASVVTPSPVRAWPTPAELAKGKGPKDRSHAPSVEVGISMRGSVIARVTKHGGEDILVFGSNPAIHTTDESLKAEMTRLATDHPGVKYVALKIGASLVCGGLQWA